MYVESRGHDSPHRETVENRRSCALTSVRPSGTWVTDAPPQMPCFPVGAYTSSGAIHATMVPDSKKMDMPLCGGGKQSSGCVTWGFHTETKKEFFSLLLDEVARECRPDGPRLEKFNEKVSATEWSRGESSPPQSVDLLEHIWQ